MSVIEVPWGDIAAGDGRRNSDRYGFPLAPAVHHIIVSPHGRVLNGRTTTQAGEERNVQVGVR